MRACLTVCLLILQFQNFSERIAYMHFDVAHHTHKQTEGYPEDSTDSQEWDIKNVQRPIINKNSKITKFLLDSHMQVVCV